MNVGAGFRSSRAAAMRFTAQMNTLPRKRFRWPSLRAAVGSICCVSARADTAVAALLLAWSGLACGGSDAADSGTTTSSMQPTAAMPAASAGQTSASPDLALPSLCSGCAQETQNAMDMTVHLHHVHLNVADRDRSVQFYQQFFEAERVRLNAATDALHVTPTLVLLEQSSAAPPSGLPTALQHMGWGSSDVAAWYEAAHAKGVVPDTRGNTAFNTSETPTIGGPGSGAFIGLLSDRPMCFPVPDTASYMYVLGPDQERIEVWSGVDRRVNHVHLTTADLAAVASWYQRFLGLTGSTPLGSWSFFLDDILFFFEPIGAAADYAPTDDHVLSHFALSVTDLDAWRKRAADQQIQVVAEPALVNGFKSFFVRGPDGVLIELVQAAPLAELCPSAMP
jgi:catechol 2,3-dioxygenase-like lactoylglutathione lyase family enzyme